MIQQPRCIFIHYKRTPPPARVMTDAEKLREAVAAQALVALCELLVIDPGHVYGITQREIDRIQSEDTICSVCMLRLSVIAANDLMFTNEGLNYMLKLVGGGT